jgi:hypothetical protein
MKTVKILTTTLLMFIFCAGMTFAQQGQHGQPQNNQKANVTPEARARQQLDQMKKDLNLSSDQVKKLQDVQTRFAKEEEQMRSNGNQSQQDMKSKMDNYDSQVKSILTQEQYQKWQEQHKNRMQNGQYGQRGQQEQQRQQGQFDQNNQKNLKYQKNQKDQKDQKNLKNQKDQKDQKMAQTTPEAKAQEQVNQMKKDLNLSSDQVKKIQKIQTKFAKEGEQMRSKGSNMSQQDMKSKMDNYDSQIQSVLTKQQYEKWQSERNNRMQNR